MNPDSFDEIRITGLDVGATQPSQRASGLRHMHLRLSAQPSSEWRQLFDNERQFPRHSMWRAAWIESSFIVVDCVPEEIEQHHLRDLKEDVANTNKKYREYLARVALAQKQQEETEQKEKSRLDELKNRLNFD